VNKKSILFSVLVEGNWRLHLTFRKPKDAIDMFRVLVKTLGKRYIKGMSLEMKPEPKVMLDRNHGAWDMWKQFVAPYSEHVGGGNLLRVSIEDGMLVGGVTKYPPMVVGGPEQC